MPRVNYARLILDPRDLTYSVTTAESSAGTFWIGISGRRQQDLKRAFFLAGFAALSDPTSRTYHDRKRAASKKHNAAMIRLARRRVDVLYSMLEHGTFHEDRSAPAAACQLP